MGLQEQVSDQFLNKREGLHKPVAGLARHLLFVTYSTHLEWTRKPRGSNGASNARRWFALGRLRGEILTPLDRHDDMLTFLKQHLEGKEICRALTERISPASLGDFGKLKELYLKHRG